MKSNWQRTRIDFGIFFCKSLLTGRTRYSVRMRIPGGVTYKTVATLVEAYAYREEVYVKTNRFPGPIGGSPELVEMYKRQRREIKMRKWRRQFARVSVATDLEATDHRTMEHDSHGARAQR